MSFNLYKMTENNKNKKYTKREKTNLVKKVTNAEDITKLMQNSNFMVTKIREKHLQS
jgi:hypothetical protein